MDTQLKQLRQELGRLDHERWEVIKKLRQFQGECSKQVLEEYKKENFFPKDFLLYSSENYIYLCKLKNFDNNGKNIVINFERYRIDLNKNWISTFAQPWQVISNSIKPESCSTTLTFSAFNFNNIKQFLTSEQFYEIIEIINKLQLNALKFQEEHQKRHLICVTKLKKLFKKFEKK